MFYKKIDRPSDEELVKDSLSGNKKSLEALIKRYQDYIFNISLRLFLDPDDALDATQEILIKVITSLKSFRAESQFKTWLYRIAFNHFLNSPVRKKENIMLESPANQLVVKADDDDSGVSEAQKEEVRVLCSTAMLMCLSREQRLIYIIGEIFGADHQLGADLFEMTPGNYRVKLHRAKTDLLNFISGKCGLINPRNPCRCPKKAKQMLDKGFIHPEKRIFHTEYKVKIHEIVRLKKDEVSSVIDLQMRDLFRDSPFQVKLDLDNLLTEIVR
jgi:RNA polymerase sigma factor (sigma-70 family)